MRTRFRAAIVFALLAATAEAGAQTPAAGAPPAQRLPCAVPAEESWSDQEKFVWRRACAGEVADFNLEPDYGGDIDPHKMPLPAKRILRGSFIRTILTQEKFANAIRQRGLRVNGARIADRLDLSNAELATQLWFERCFFAQSVDMSWLRTSQPIAFNKSQVPGSLIFYAAQMGADLHVKESSVGLIDLNGAHVVRTLDLTGSRANEVAMPALDVVANLDMANGAYGKLDLRGARIGHALDLTHASATTEAVMRGLEVGTTLDMSDGGVFSNLDLRGARVGNTLNLEDSTVVGQMLMDGLRVGVYLNLRHATLPGASLLGARTQQLALEGATVTGEIDMLDVQVGTDLWMTSARFFAPLKLRYMQIGGQLDWSGSQFHASVDLTGSRIGGALKLDDAKWFDGAVLIARFAKIGVIPRLANHWPDEMEIDGLTYEGLHTIGDDHVPWFEKVKRYSRQPYQQLASVLQAQGDVERATAVRFAERDRDRSRPEQVWYIAGWLGVLKWVIGYGYYPYYSLVWIVVFVVLGALVLRWSGEGRRNNMPIGLSYSFDMLLPVIRLRDRHYQMDLHGWARYYFYAHKIMGWVLASFLVAGLSGLTK
jgi:uncharacterized protein YjbI with pentapeptide repeats